MSENTDPLADHVPVYEDDVRGDRVVGTVQVCAATGDPWPCAAVTPDDPAPCCESHEEISSGWLVEVHNHCTIGCEPAYGHQPGCGMVPLVRLDTLPGWPAAVDELDR